MNYEIIQDTAIIIGASLLLGYIIFSLLLFLLPKRLETENLQQKALIIQRALKKKEQIFSESKLRIEEQLSLVRDELETSLNDLAMDMQVTNEELNSQESLMQQTEARIVRQEKELENYKLKVDSLRNKYMEDLKTNLKIKTELQSKLEIIAECKIPNIKSTLVEDQINERQLESQRYLKDLTDSIDSQSKKIANRVLNRILSRYSPDFIWPKALNHVEISSQKIVENLQSANNSLIKDLSELSEGVEITLSKEGENGLYAIKLGGGYGIYKEAARMTLEEILPKGVNQWSAVSKYYEKHKFTLEKLSNKLGLQAVSELQLSNVHPEIQKMIGALNWRTSYRQNQYYHSLEVAKLSGILAHEIGINPILAKRCGLLHDIGKGIDYKIEGSHAIISCDYADRFGESKIVCDTILSHHNDLVLDTPLSYVLKTADTLSGARPGARIHLEEGYQIRLLAIDQSIKSFPGIQKISIMSGGREVHIEVNHKKTKEHQVEELTRSIARKVEENVAFPGQIKIVVTRRFEAVAIA
ncbi:MAG: HDIG domain-containing protein [Oligoflexales bacterium]|nr:HDIG domain-containing protein [Oligoflexales bacterium]